MILFYLKLWQTRQRTLSLEREINERLAVEQELIGVTHTDCFYSRTATLSLTEYVWRVRGVHFDLLTQS
jgi:hypothetical protein